MRLVTPQWLAVALTILSVSTLPVLVDKAGPLGQIKVATGKDLFEAEHLKSTRIHHGNAATPLS